MATLLALNNSIIKLKSVKETSDKLDEACTMTNVSNITLHWIKGHAGHGGNVRADSAALRGAQDSSLMVLDPPALPKATIHLECRNMVYSIWRDEWAALPPNECRQTKLWFPNGPRPRLSYSILRLPRVACGQMIQFMTGHNFLKRHQAIIDKSDNKACSFCDSGEDETTEHIMSHCNRFATLRQLCFNDPYPAPPYTNLQFEQIVNFLKFAKINTIELHSSVREMLRKSRPEWVSSSESEAEN